MPAPKTTTRFRSTARRVPSNGSPFPYLLFAKFRIQSLGDGLIKVKRAPCDIVAETADDDIWDLLCRVASCPLPMSRIDPILAAPLEHRMAADQPAFVQNPDAVGKL